MKNNIFTILLGVVRNQASQIDESMYASIRQT